MGRHLSPKPGALMFFLLSGERDARNITLFQAARGENTMSRIVKCLVLIIAVAMFAGCEWDTVGEDVESWNDAHGWVNFSGIYRALDGGILVTDFTYTSTAGGGGGTNSGGASVQTAVSGEVIAYGVDDKHAYGGTVENHPVVAGTFAISAGGFVFNDDGDGVLVGTAGTAGTISYANGAWSIDLNALEIGQGVAIVAGYVYEASGPSAPQAEPGNTGDPIYTFLVEQLGNRLTITDSGGSVYTGTIQDLASTSGETGANTPNLVAGQVIATFTVSGVSAAGKSVRIMGTLTAGYSRSTSSTSTGGGDVDPAGGGAGDTIDLERVYLRGRLMSATWIEDDGTTADIVGATVDYELVEDAGAGADAGGGAEQ